MKIEIVKIEQTDDMLRRVFEHCWGIKTKMNKSKIFACNDSILEVFEYYAVCTAPRSVAMQLRTHEKKHGMYFWMATARPDRDDAVKGDYSREQEVNFVMKLTAKAIKEISHYRMCAKAEYPTREFMFAFKEELYKIEPELAENMVPLCVYRGGLCTEFNSCKNRKIVK